MTQARRLLGDAIRATRRRRGWSQQQLALEAGTSQRRIYALEAGLDNPRLDTLARLLLVLGCELQVTSDVERFPIAS